MQEARGPRDQSKCDRKRKSTEPPDAGARIGNQGLEIGVVLPRLSRLTGRASRYRFRVR
jgi:hypothetical protein